MKLIQSAAKKGDGYAEAIKNDLAKAAIWGFYRSNPDRVIVKVGGFIKVRVRDLHFLFELLAGPEPQ